MKPTFEECASCAAKPGAPQLCDACVLRRREIEQGRWAGHSSGRGHGPGGRLVPMVGDTVQTATRAEGFWRNHYVSGHDFWRQQFDLDRDSGEVTLWRWPHKKALMNANGKMGVEGPCCRACDPPDQPGLEQEADALLKEWLSATDGSLSKVVHHLRHRVAPARTAALAVLLATRLNDAERGMLLVWLRRGL